jgi:membrane-associated phospholipid phosphatase
MPSIPSAEQRTASALLAKVRQMTAVSIDWLDGAPWLIIAGTAIAAAVWTAHAGFAVKGIGWAIGGVVPLVAAAIYFRSEERFLLCITVLLQVVLFSSFFALLSYLAVAFAGPLWDNRLAEWDAALGFDLVALLTWKAHHPLLGAILDASYNSMLLQTAAVVVILGFSNDRVPLKLFVLRMMLAGLVTFVFIAALPAEGTPNQYGLTPTPAQANYLEHLHALRSGALRQFDFGRVEGLATFPSYHAIWSILIAVACFHRSGVRLFFLALNALAILSTLTTGGHYLCDVLGGAVIAAAVCLITPAGNHQPKMTADHSASRSREEPTASPL